MKIPHLLGDYLTMATNAFHDYWQALLHPNFVHPSLILLMPVLLFCSLMWGTRQVKIRHSALAPHKGLQSWSAIVLLGYGALALGSANLDVALMAPQVPQAVEQHLVQTRNVCVANDGSGSMTTELNEGIPDVGDAQAQSTNDPTAVTVTSRTNDKAFVQGTQKQEAPPHKMNRADAAQMASGFLIGHRMTIDPMNTDRFCLFRFDDDLYVLAPLSNDKVALLLRSKHITENVGGGTNFINALQKAYDYFIHNTSTDSTRVLVMNTDGFDSIDPQKRKELIDLYVAAHIRFYVIGLGDGWKEGNTLDLQKFADELHKADPRSGIVFRAQNPGQMKLAMEAIDAQEASNEIFELKQINREVDGVFILGSVFFVFMFLGFATIARRNP
jgi:hypothetical protein